MADKPIKIKRNGSISGRRRQRNSIIKKIISVVFALAALLAIGFLGAPAIMEMVENINHPQSQPSQPSETQPVQPPETQPSADPSDVQIDSVEKYIYGVLEQNSLVSESEISAAIDKLKQKGVDNVVVTLKDKQGLVWFDTQTEIGMQAKAKTLVDIKRLVEICAEKDVSVTAQLYVFCDKTAPTINRDTAVKYKGTDMNWLDTSKEFGGKPWANPASSVMQEYIYTLTDEISAKGIKDFIFSGVQLPVGYSLDMRDFGASESQLQAQIQGFINTVSGKAEAKGGNAYFAFDAAAISGADVEKYIIQPQRYGVENIVVFGSAEELEKYGNSALASLKGNSDVERVVVWSTDANSDLSADNGKFVK